MLVNIREYVKHLGLKRPFEIHLKSSECEDATAKYYAVYTRKKLKKHLIKVYLENMWGNPENERSLETIIAHELIHAWQEENNFTDTHGISFQSMAARMSYIFSLPDIYMPERDLE